MLCRIVCTARKYVTETSTTDSIICVYINILYRICKYVTKTSTTNPTHFLSPLLCMT